MNEVVARCSLFTGILFVHPGLKHSYEIRTATLVWQMLFEQLGSVCVDGHAAVFGCLSQAVSEFPVQIERHVHLSTSLQGRPGGPLLVHAGGTPIKTTTVDNSPGPNPSAGKDRYPLYRAQRMQSTRCERDLDHPLAVQRVGWTRPPDGWWRRLGADGAPPGRQGAGCSSRSKFERRPRGGGDDRLAEAWRSEPRSSIPTPDLPHCFPNHDSTFVEVEPTDMPYSDVAILTLSGFVGFSRTDSMSAGRAVCAVCDHLRMLTYLFVNCQGTKRGG